LARLLGIAVGLGAIAAFGIGTVSAQTAATVISAVLVCAVGRALLLARAIFSAHGQVWRAAETTGASTGVIPTLLAFTVGYTGGLTIAFVVALLTV
jgi:hypothetical protein